MNAFTLTLLGGGGLLIYCAINDYNPRDVILYGLGGPPPVKMSSGGMSAAEQNRLRHMWDGYPNTPNYLQRDPNSGQELPQTPSTDGSGGPALYNGNPTTDTPATVVGL